MSHSVSVYTFFFRKLANKGEVNSVRELGNSHKPLKWPDSVCWVWTLSAISLAVQPVFSKQPNMWAKHQVSFQHTCQTHWCQRPRTTTYVEHGRLPGLRRKSSAMPLMPSQPGGKWSNILLHKLFWTQQLKLSPAVKREIQQKWILGQ